MVDTDAMHDILEPSGPNSQRTRNQPDSIPERPATRLMEQSLLDSTIFEFEAILRRPIT